MASSSPPTTTADSRDKTVIGYPAHPSLIAAGYPPPPPPQTAYPINAAYPSVAPTPTTFSRITYRHSIPTHNIQQRNLLSRVLSAFIVAVFVLFVLFFVVWIFFRPRLPEFGVKSASLSPLNATRSSELSANWDITFFVKNPNDKLSVYYDRVEARIVYGDEYLLTGTQLPNFYQDKMNETAVHSRFAVATESVDGNVLGSILAERASGSVSFDVRVLALIRFHKGAWRTRRHLLRVSCEDVRFGFSPPNNDGSGSLLGGPRACKVAL